MVLLQFLLCVIIVLLLLYYFIGRYNEYYWKKQGVTIYQKNKAIGPFWEFLIGDRSLTIIFNDIYKSYRKEPAVAFGSLLNPTLYVTDKRNIQHVLQTDFQSFNHRGPDISNMDILADNILFMNGNRWKLMRQSMSPLFTSSKLKNMYYTVDKSAQDLVTYIKDDPSKWNANVFETLNTFCSAAIGAAVFGITTKSIFDSPFLEMAKKATAPTPGNQIKFFIGRLFPTVIKAMGIKVFGDFEDFFIGAIKQVLRQREKENVKRHDFADICVTLQKNEILKDPETNYEIAPTDEVLAAQAFFFFIAGVEPTAQSLFSVLTEIGRHPEVLQKVHDEIDKLFETHSGQLSYDAINELEYLDMVYNEGLRLYPPIGFLTRKCVRDSVLPVGHIKVLKDTSIITPIFEVHHDPEYYEDSEVFNPERFLKNKYDDITFMPFGKGPRLCLGMRYARLQAKTGLAHLLRNFTVKTTVPESGIQYDKQTVQVRVGNAHVELIPRKIKNIN